MKLPLLTICGILNRISLITSAAGLFFTADAIKPKRPVVIWHGATDSCCDTNWGTGVVVAHLRNAIPDLYIKSVALGDTIEEDKRTTFFGNSHQIIDKVCKELASDPKLKHGFDAVGFSQGALFMRGYIEKCNNPPVHTFITYGGINSGTASTLKTFGPNVLLDTINSVLTDIPYSKWAQEHCVFAQHHKNPKLLDDYLENSGFLADINNERKVKNAIYKKNFSSLSKFVMIRFIGETIVNPPESAWFGYYDGKSTSKVSSMRQQPMYKEDWIGLKALDKQKKIVFDELPGEHMELSGKAFVETLQKHLWSKKQ